jgi:hypothetical protein
MGSAVKEVRDINARWPEDMGRIKSKAHFKKSVRGWREYRMGGGSGGKNEAPITPDVKTKNPLEKDTNKEKVQGCGGVRKRGADQLYGAWIRPINQSLSLRW